MKANTEINQEDKILLLACVDRRNKYLKDQLTRVEAQAFKKWEATLKEFIKEGETLYKKLLNLRVNN